MEKLAKMQRQGGVISKGEGHDEPNNHNTLMLMVGGPSAVGGRRMLPWHGSLPQPTAVRH